MISVYFIQFSMCNFNLYWTLARAYQSLSH